MSTLQARNPHTGPVPDPSAVETSAKPRAYFVRGYARARENKLDEAIADLSEAIRLKADFPEAYLERGTTHLRAGNVDRAVADFKEAARIKG